MAVRPELAFSENPRVRRFLALPICGRAACGFAVFDACPCVSPFQCCWFGRASSHANAAMQR